jgi:hypothetical protein
MLLPLDSHHDGRMKLECVCMHVWACCDLKMLMYTLILIILLLLYTVIWLCGWFPFYSNSIWYMMEGEGNHWKCAMYNEHCELFSHMHVVYYICVCLMHPFLICFCLSQIRVHILFPWNLVLDTILVPNATHVHNFFEYCFFRNTLFKMYQQLKPLFVLHTVWKVPAIEIIIYTLYLLYCSVAKEGL